MRRVASAGRKNKNSHVLKVFLVPSTPVKPHPLLKIVLEIGPLALFLLANAKPKLFAPLAGLVLPAELLGSEKAGIFTATLLLMAGVLLALIVSLIVMKRLPVMPLVTAAVVTIFGTLTLYFQDDQFIKMKPTFLNLIFGGILIGGLAFDRPLLPYVLDAAFRLTHEGWRKLTLRWGLFFLVLAGLNELVWRTQSTNFWVNFKVYGSIGLTFLFIMSQMPLIMRYDSSKIDSV
jgi:intracellular septation protein